MVRGFILLSFAFIFICESTQAFDCRKISIQIRNFATNLFVDPDIKSLLAKNHIQILHWKGSVAVLSASLNGMTGSSSILELCLEDAQPQGSLILKKVDDALFSKIGGRIVYVQDRRSGKIVFVGVPEGCEENSQQVLMTADLILKLGLDTRTLSN